MINYSTPKVQIKTEPFKEGTSLILAANSLFSGIPFLIVVQQPNLSFDESPNS